MTASPRRCGSSAILFGGGEGGEVLQSRWNFHEERDASLWRDMPRQKGSLVRAILNYRWPPCAWIFMCCMHRRPYRTTINLTFSLGGFFPAKRSQTILFPVQLLGVNASVERYRVLPFLLSRREAFNWCSRRNVINLEAPSLEEQKRFVKVLIFNGGVI